MSASTKQAAAPLHTPEQVVARFYSDTKHHGDSHHTALVAAVTALLAERNDLLAEVADLRSRDERGAKDESRVRAQADALALALTMGLNAWARSLGITHSSIQGRLRRGWPIEMALTKPKRHEVRK